MKSSTFYCLLLITYLSLGLEIHGQCTEQKIQLRPGWNAVFLEVQPEPAECEALFAGLPVESVWDFNNAVDLPQFVQDPSTLLPGTPGWLTWFPPNDPLAGQRTLFRLRDGRPYLIKLANNAKSVTWSVIGKPSLRRLTWKPGSLNFVGFHLGQQAASFQTLFAGESGLVGQSIYALDAAGVWRAFPDLSAAHPKGGEAYWIRCRLPAERSASIQVEPASSQGLTFAGSMMEQSLRIRNTSSGSRNITIRVLPVAQPPAGQPTVAGPVPLEYRLNDYARTNLTWEPFSAPISFSALPVGQEWNVRLGARLGGVLDITVGKLQSLLEVTDDLGTRWVVPVTAGSSLETAGFEGSQNDSIPSPHTGLWVGEAVLNAVSHVGNVTDPVLPRTAGGDFSFRIIIHVDHGGAARLLQRVYLVRKPPVLVPDPEEPELNRIAEPGRIVAFTDEALIPGVIGPGEISGRRVSSAAFGFKQPLSLSGGTFGSGTLNGVAAIGFDDPLNPFKHLYHPDHNNLDERFEQKLVEGRESFTVSRSVSFEFTGTDPSGLNPPGWGTSELGGIYRESIAGLHRDVIRVKGTFRMVRISDAGVLNQ